MAGQKVLVNASLSDEQLFGDLKRHYDLGFDETDRRATGRNRIGSISFDEADELFRSWLDENTWPYDALLFDPRIFTFIFEKTSRLIANKPKGRVIPREGSDMLAARINNELLSYQWDQATVGGTMLSKWSLMDINARKYGASFALAKWRYETAADGKRVLFDGPEMKVLKNRDCAHDIAATSLEDCNWFHVREYPSLQELKRVNDASRKKPIYKNLDKLEFAVASDSDGNGGEGRGPNWISRNRTISGLENDPVGKDVVFKTVEIVTEYRRDRWITFAPKHGVVLRDIENPYANNELPIVMLRYYAIDDDLYGLSEIEPIKGLQKAINALLCQYVDEMNQKLYSPIAVGPGVRQHTLEWGKGARWIMNNPQSDFRLVESQSNAAQFFNNTYSVLVAAMMNALGESSLGVSNAQPYQTDKTATEVKALQLQRNARDQYNQNFLAEAIKRQYKLWHSMNQTLLFSDEEAQPYILRIVGRDALEYFEKKGLGSDDVSGLDGDSAKAFFQIARKNNFNVDSSSVGGPGVLPELKPKYPVNKDGKTIKKFEMSEDGRDGFLALTPEDITGSFDFIIDVESMAVSSNEEKKQARQTAVQAIMTNPAIVQLLGMEGYVPKFKDLFVTWLEDLGFPDAQRYFEKQQQEEGPGTPEEMLAKMKGPQGRPPKLENIASSGIPGGTNPNQGGEANQSFPFSVDAQSLGAENLSKFKGNRLE